MLGWFIADKKTSVFHFLMHLNDNSCYEKGQTVLTETTLRDTKQDSYEANSKEAALTH